MWEDKTVTATGAYNATATSATAANWVMQLVTFKDASAAPAGFNKRQKIEQMDPPIL